MRNGSDDLQAEVLFDDELVIAAGSKYAMGTPSQHRSCRVGQRAMDPATAGHMVPCIRVSKLFKARGNLKSPKAVWSPIPLLFECAMLSEGPYITTFASSIIGSMPTRYALTASASRVLGSTVLRRDLDPEEPNLEPCGRALLAIARAVAKPFAGSGLQSQVVRKWRLLIGVSGAPGARHRDAYFRIWPKTDIRETRTDVRFRGGKRT